VLVALAALAGGCASKAKMSETNLPVCRTVAECRAHEGERVEVVGVYALHDYRPVKKKDSDAPLPAYVQLGDQRGPFLEPFWHQAAQRSQDEIQRYQGKSVAVVGVFHGQQPADPANPDGAAMGGSCLHPVESIREAE
jgi:hypothetical protein